VKGHLEDCNSLPLQHGSEYRHPDKKRQPQKDSTMGRFASAVPVALLASLLISCGSTTVFNSPLTPSTTTGPSAGGTPPPPRSNPPSTPPPPGAASRVEVLYVVRTDKTVQTYDIDSSSGAATPVGNPVAILPTGAVVPEFVPQLICTP